MPMDSAARILSRDMLHTAKFGNLNKMQKKWQIRNTTKTDNISV